MTTGREWIFHYSSAGALTPHSPTRGPSDEQQFETMDAGHFLYLLLESDRPNMLFRSPISNPKASHLASSYANEMLTFANSTS